jgi:hypothetical protein
VGHIHQKRCAKTKNAKAQRKIHTAILQKWLSVAAVRGNLLVMAWCKDRGATGFDNALVSAARDNQLAAMRLCKEWGATKFDAAIVSASLFGCFRAIKLCRSWLEEGLAQMRQRHQQHGFTRRATNEQQAEVFVHHTLCKRAYASAAKNSFATVNSMFVGDDADPRTIMVICKMWAKEEKVRAGAALELTTQAVVASWWESKSKAVCSVSRLALSDT